jgi:hypothetical protein
MVYSYNKYCKNIRKSLELIKTVIFFGSLDEMLIIEIKYLEGDYIEIKYSKAFSYFKISSDLEITKLLIFQFLLMK